MNTEALARLLILAGAGLLLGGLALLALSKLGWPRLPGDFVFGGEHWKVYLPIGTSILLSIGLTLLLQLFSRFWR